ncbi:PrgI family protein [Spongiactinospora sp. TRM90649]|uniref:PrgI family protein n=1 Tax=Spongiactinospora sp. TRM90649 TaxID=3031114 RepID=UPI0023F87C67|nr:PrgI family protein [Spongiactinospora sp. TRM90649]MDF5754839.1 PrgI family protein [Spongiactinospora sp. TRM90649]
MSWTEPVRIPNVDQEDRIVGGFTARQVAILGATAGVLYTAYLVAGEGLSLLVFAAVALPIALAGLLLAIGRRGGVALDRYLLAALRHARRPKHLIGPPGDAPSPPAWIAIRPGPRPAPLRLPAHGVTGDGLIDLGPDGVAAVAEVSTLSFALRTPNEQDALVAVFGRWLHSLSGPAQILIRAEQVDLTGIISTLAGQARTLAHPALAAAAQEHADFLADLAARHELLRRQVLLIVREPSPARALRRLEEATRLLSACGLTVRMLNGHAIKALLASCFDPTAPPCPQLEPTEIITRKRR